MERAIEEHLENERAIVSELSAEEQAELYRLLAKLLDGARRPGPEKT